MRTQEFDTSVDLLKAILWHYEDATRLKTLMQLKQEWLTKNQSEFWNNWYRDVFNVDTATRFGLAVWGRILDIKLGVEFSPEPAKVSFGFGVNNKNFNNGNFGRQSQSRLTLTTEQQRMVIRMRYFQLTCRGAIPEINEFLAYIFKPYGQVYVIDNYDMTMTYFFAFSPTSDVQFILDNYDLLPRPSGVKINWVFFQGKSFGFGPENLNFNNGNFGG